LFLAQPSLLALKAKGASYDLVAPGPSELAEIVRKPVDAAGLIFETDSETGERLDDKLLLEADRPDMLPLLQLMLNRLFENRTEISGEIQLTFAAERALGGLPGVIEREGERALQALDEDAIASLPRLLRHLAAVGHDTETESSGAKAAVTARMVSLAAACDSEPARRLVHALVDARLLLTSGEGAEIRIRLAHERVLTDWARARDLVAANAEFYRMRAEIEESLRRWEAASRSRDLLIPRGLPLAEAEVTLGDFGDELAPGAREFILLSGRRARRHQRLTKAAAVLFAVLAFGATAVGVFAEREQHRANRSLAAAKDAVSVIVRDVANGFRNVQGIRTEKIRTVLEHIQQTVDGLRQEAPNDPAIARLNLEMLDQFAMTYFTVNDLERARASALDALSLARELGTNHSQEADKQRNIAVVLTRVGAIELRRGDLTAALKANQEAVEIIERLMRAAPGNSLWPLDLASALSGIGDVKM
jgi:tetratricopeptide (TPR) repeat protein